MKHAQIKIFLLLTAMIFIIMVIPTTAVKTKTEVPIYEARTKVLVSLRPSIGSTRKTTPIERNTHIKIYEYKDGWCKVKYDKQTGWIDEQYLWAFRPLKSEEYPLPHQHTNNAVITLMNDVELKSDTFTGRTYIAPSSFCVNFSKNIPTVYLWRDEIVLTDIKYDVTPFVSWQDAKPGDIISGFSTFYTEDQGTPYQENREKNLQLSCERINDTVIPAHGRFSFNDLCAPYAKTNKYGVAPSVGGSGKGPGGGVCQVSTTMFNAILGLPIDINEWYLHSQDGVPYIPLSFDASVGPDKDFVFTSRLDYPIRVKAEAKDGIVTILLLRDEGDNT